MPQEDDLDRAIADYTRAIELNPTDAEAYHGRGIAHAAKGNYDEAIKDYDRALLLNQSLTQAVHNRAVAIALREGQKEKERLEQEFGEQREDLRKKHDEELKALYKNLQKGFEEEEENLTKWQEDSKKQKETSFTISLVALFVLGVLIVPAGLAYIVFCEKPQETAEGVDKLFSFVPYLFALGLIIASPVWFIRIMQKRAAQGAALEQSFFRQRQINRLIRSASSEDYDKQKRLIEFLISSGNPAELIASLESSGKDGSPPMSNAALIAALLAATRRGGGQIGNP